MPQPMEFRSRSGLRRRLAPGASRPRPAGRMRGWSFLTSRRLRVSVLLIVVIGVEALVAHRRSRPPVDLTPPRPHPVRHVKEFGLADVQGVRHTAAEWRRRKAIVLFSLGAQAVQAGSYDAEMSQLAAQYGPRGINFYGVVADAAATAGQTRDEGARRSLGFPILLDPAHVVLGQAGLRAIPDAAVLHPDGQVLYLGWPESGSPAHGERREGLQAGGLRAALDSIVAGEMPTVTEAPASGSPLRSPRSLNQTPVTFTKDVAPILWRNCASCHRRGEVGPFPLLTYRDAARRADFIAEITASRRMPPWKAQPGHGVFLDSLLLTDRELETLAAWAEAGAPEGDPADLPAPPTFPSGWRLGTPDLVYQVSEPYAVRSDGPDDFRSFVIPIPLDHDQHVAAFELRPGNRRVVHHAKLFCDPTGNSRKRDAADPAPGFASLGSADIGQPAIWEWTPGTVPRPAPEGAGWILKAHSDLVLFIHYHPSGKPETDQSSVGVYLSKAPLRRQIAGIPLASQRIDIPPGAKRHLVTASTTLPADAHAYGLLPHAHYLLREMWLKAIRPDGTVQSLLWINDWDFNWQGHYAFARPVALPRGTRLELVAYYDNSADNPRNPSSPPKRVRFGPSSTDEMLGCHIQIIPDDPATYPTFRKKWPTGF